MSALGDGGHATDAGGGKSHERCAVGGGRALYAGSAGWHATCSSGGGRHARCALWVESMLCRLELLNDMRHVPMTVETCDRCVGGRGCCDRATGNGWRSCSGALNVMCRTTVGLLSGVSRE